MTSKVIMKGGWPAYSCERCMGEGWVCENHPDKPWHETKGCICGAGDPCPDCNEPVEGAAPRLPPDMIVDEITEGKRRRNQRCKGRKA